MKISAFAISTDKTKLELTIEDAATVVSLRFWNDRTYRDFSRAKDFSSKLTGAATENIEITLADISEDYFDGIYFIEAEDTDETSLEFVYTYNRYRECILNKILEVANCNDCLQNLDIDTIAPIITADVLLDSLVYASQQRFADEMLIALKALKKYCDNDCATCGGITTTTTTTSSGDENFGNVIIIFDGGSLD